MFNGGKISAQELYEKLGKIIEKSDSEEPISIEVCSGYGREESLMGMLSSITVRENISGKKTIVFRAEQEDMKDM